MNVIAPSRRQFVAMSGASLLTAALSGCSTHIGPDTSPTTKLARPGIQLFTIRDTFQSDPLAALKAVAAAGFADVEFGSGGYFDREPAELKDMLNQTELVAPAMHVGLSALTGRLDRVVEMAKTIGARHVVLPAVPKSMRSTVEQWRMGAAACTDAATRLADHGLSLAYHNHAFEFDPLDGGGTGFDILTGETSPDLVKLELDFYWVLAAKQDPLALIDQHAGRIVTCHVKDITAAGEMALPGEGVADFQSYFLKASKAGLEHFFVEHDKLRAVHAQRLRAAADTLKGMIIA